MKITVRKITPKIAQNFLGKLKVGHRCLNQEVVNTYALDMTNGKWYEYGSIVFDANGDLIDGAHRLEAVKKSQMTITFAVQTGADVELSKVLDTGYARTTGQIFRSYGITNGFILGPCVVKYLEIKQAIISNNIRKVLAFGAKTSTNKNRHRISPREALEEYYLHSHDWDSIIVEAKNHRSSCAGSMTVSDIASLMMYMEHDLGYSGSDITKFFNYICDPNVKGPQVTEDLKQILRDSRLYTNLRKSKQEKSELFIMAWNAYMQGQNITLAWSPTKGLLEFM